VPVVLCDRSGGLFSDEVTLRAFLEGAISPSGPYLNMAVPFDRSYADGGAATEGGRDGEARRFSLSSNDASADEKDAELRSDRVAGNESVQLPHTVALAGNARVGAILLALPPPHAATKGASEWTVASFSNLQANVKLPAKTQLGVEEHSTAKTMEPSLRPLSGSVSATVSMAQVTPSTNGSLDHRSNNRRGIYSNIWCEQDSGLHKMLVAPFSTSAEISAGMLDNATAHSLLSHFLDTIAIEFAVSPQGDNSAMIPLIQRRASGNEATTHADSMSEYESALAAAGLGFPVGRQSGETTDASFLATSSSSTDGAGDSQGTAPLPPPPQQHQQFQLPFDETQQPASMAALAANLPARVVPRLLAFVREQTQSITALQDVLESEGWQFPTLDSPETAAASSRTQVPAEGITSSSNDTSPSSTASAMASDATASLGQHTQAARLLCDELRASLQSAQSSSGDAAAATLAKANEVQRLLNQAANLQERTAATWAAHAADLTARARAAAAAEAKAAAMLASSEAQRVEDHEARRRADKALTALEARRVAKERQHKEALAALEERLHEAEKRATGRAESSGTPSLPPRSKGRPSLLGNWMPSSS